MAISSCSYDGRGVTMTLPQLREYLPSLPQRVQDVFRQKMQAMHEMQNYFLYIQTTGSKTIQDRMPRIETIYHLAFAQEVRGLMLNLDSPVFVKCIVEGEPVVPPPQFRPVVEGSGQSSCLEKIFSCLGWLVAKIIACIESIFTIILHLFRQ